MKQVQSLIFLSLVFLVKAQADVCEAQLEQFSQALGKNEEWAVRLVDTWAKIRSGYLSGNLIDLGDFDSCVRFRYDGIQGQHCLTVIVPVPDSTLDNNNNNSELTLRIFANFLRNFGTYILNGLCLPASCSPESILAFLNQRFLITNDLFAYSTECKTNDPPPLNTLEYFAITFFSLILLLMIASTFYEIIAIRKGINTNKLLISFSAYTSCAKLYDVTKSKSASSINCLHGLRTMSVLWIILGHRFFNQFWWANPVNFTSFNLSVWNAVIASYTIAVDTFFVMGALLMTISTLRDCEKGNLNIARMIWKRYIRYTPVFGAVILFTVSFAKYLATGPFDSTPLTKACANSWWLALLHVQNYLPMEEMCLGHGWYLSADFQLFLISPFIVYLIHKFGRKLLTIPVLLCLATIIYVIVMASLFDIRVAAPNEYFTRFIYFSTHSRAGPWFIGIVLGFFLYKNRGKVIRISKWFNALMWIVSLSTLSAIIFFRSAFARHPEASQIANIAFLALHRNLWAVALCWIIFAIQHLKTGGFVRWFLSLPHWQPISRMSLSMYIVGVVYQVIMILNQRVPLYLNVWHIFPILWSDIVAIIIIATICYLAFETPPIMIEEYFYEKFKARKHTMRVKTDEENAKAP